MSGPKPSVMTVGDDLVGVPDANGVFTTAVRPAQEQPSAQPVAQPPEQILEKPQESTAEERAQERFEAVAGRTGQGEFIPSTVAEQVDFERGTSGAVFRQGFNEGLIGALLDMDKVSPPQKIQIETEAANYSGRNPYTALATGMAGRFASDLPAEILVAIGTGGLGVAAKTVATTHRFGQSAQRIAKSVNALRDATRNGKLGTRIGMRAGQDAMEGFAGGVLSEGIRQELGRGTSFEDAINAGLNDAAVAPAFGFLMRGAAKFAGKPIAAYRKSYADKVAKDITEDMSPEIKASGLKVADVEARVANQIMERVKQPQPSKLDNSIEAKSALNTPEAKTDFKRVKTKGDLVEFNSRYLHPDEEHLAEPIADLISRRAEATGLSLKQYTDAKGLSFKDAKGEPSTLFREGLNIISAPVKNTRAVDMIHEIGHVMRSDMMLTKSYQKNGPALEKHYGVKEGKWTRDQEEALTNDFVRSIGRIADAPNRKAKFQDGDLNLPEKVKGAFKDMAGWLWKTYEKFFRRGVPNELIDVVGELFTPGTSGRRSPKKIAAELKSKDAQLLLERQAEGTTELFASGKEPEVEADVPLAEGVAEAQGKQLDFTERIQAGDISTGTAIPDANSTPGKAVAKAKKNRSFLWWQNTTLNLQLRQLGSVGQEITQMGYKAANESGKIAIKAHETFSNLMSKISVEDMTTLKEVKEFKFDTVTLDGNNKVIVGSDKVSLNGQERMKLTALARDGARRSNLRGSRTQHSAGDALILPGQEKVGPDGKEVNAGGIEIQGKHIVLTRAQRDAIADGALLSDTEAKALEAFHETFRAVVPMANKITQRLAGRDVFDANNKFFTIKSTVDSPNKIDDTDLSFDSFLDPTSKDRTPFMERRGPGTLTLRNPFEELNFYIEQMSHTLGHLEYNKSVDTFLDKGRTDLEQLISPAYRNNLLGLLKVSKGDRSDLGKDKDSVVSKLFSLRQLGILSGSVGAALKQAGSGFSAAATGLLNENGFHIMKRIGEYVASPKARKAKIAEMEKASPAFAHRQLKSSRMLDVDDVGSGSMHLAMGRELSVKDIVKLALKREISLSDATIELLDKAMILIKTMDEATMASLWDSTAKTIKQGGGNGRSQNEIFTQLMMDSQPTRTPTTTSLNQMKGGIGARFFTQFSTQTRKNSELMDESITTYLNKPDGARTRQDKEAMFRTVLPMMVQTAYITLAGAAATAGTNEMTDKLSSRKAQRSRARFERQRARDMSLAKRMFTSYMRTGLSQVPISGSSIDALFAGLMGDKVYDSAIPIVGEISELAAGMSDRDIARMQKSLGTLMGVPSLANKAISASLK